MPEIITPGVSGALISGNDKHELAATIAATLADDTLYEACYERAPELAKYFSWERAAREMAHVISQTVSSQTSLPDRMHASALAEGRLHPDEV